MAAWGSVVLATGIHDISRPSHQGGIVTDLYSTFVANGELSGQRLSYEAGESMALIHD